MSLPLLTESMVLTDAGALVAVWHVDLRRPLDRTPVTTLVKACCKEHALTELGSIRISKPSLFRSSGEGLIRDSEEMRVSRSVLTSQRINDPGKLADELQIADELNRCAAATGGQLLKPRFKTGSTKETIKRKRFVESGKNGWIYCTSIKPRNDEEERKWKVSLPEKYDHVDADTSKNLFSDAV